MFVVCVHVHVKPEKRDEFVRASTENGQSTIHEPGALRFDVLQSQEDPNRFVLYEVYRDESGAAAHKDTPHYAKWRDAVAPWMAEPRHSVKYTSLYPESPDHWAAAR